jgi:hypothetical protein
MEEASSCRRRRPTFYTIEIVGYYLRVISMLALHDGRTAARSSNRNSLGRPTSSS